MLSVEPFEDSDEVSKYLIWAQTDILFITTKRDGLYMSPLEYVIVRNELGKEAKSAVLMSEFVGGSLLLSGSFRFNPYSIREIVNCLEHAIYNITPEDKTKKFRSMLDYVKTHPIEKWVFKFLKDIKFINQKRKRILGNEGKQLINNKLNFEKKLKFANSKEFVLFFII